MQIKNKKVLCFGEVLWDRLPSGAKPGGAPMNVALHLNAIGLEVAIASRVGNDEAGKELTAFLESSGMKTDLIQMDENLPTSEVLIRLNEKNNATYEICEPVAWDNIQLTESLTERAQEAGLIIYGSLASRRKQTQETLSKLLKYDAVRLIDVNLRKPYDKREIVEPLLERSDIIKLNDDELAILAGWNNQNGLKEKKLVKWLAAQYGTALICVTKGEHGALLFAEGQFYEHSGFNVNTVDSVGAGDAFLAGLVAGLLEDKSYHEALAFACGTGAFVASKAGATPKYDMGAIHRILASDLTQIKKKC